MPAHFWFEIRGTEKYSTCRKLKGDKGEKYIEVSEYEYRKYKEGERKHPVYIERDIQDLQDVDVLMCQFLNDPKPSRNLDSPAYHMCHELGFWTLYRMGGEHIEERHVEDMIKVQTKYWTEKTDWNEGKIARHQMFIRWVFLHKWVFQATG